MAAAKARQSRQDEDEAETLLPRQPIGAEPMQPRRSGDYAALSASIMTTIIHRSALAP